MLIKLNLSNSDNTLIKWLVIRKNYNFRLKYVDNN